jgi:hypothetical protein
MDTKLSPAQIKFDFRRLSLEAGRLKQLEGDEYFKAQEAFNGRLRTFLREDFSVLSTHQLLTLISWVSSHRPVAPHSFLITCANLINS